MSLIPVATRRVMLILNYAKDLHYSKIVFMFNIWMLNKLLAIMVVSFCWLSTTLFLLGQTYLPSCYLRRFYRLLLSGLRYFRICINYNYCAERLPGLFFLGHILPSYLKRIQVSIAWKDSEWSPYERPSFSHLCSIFFSNFRLFFLGFISSDCCITLYDLASSNSISFF